MKIKMTILTACVAVLALTGCASGDYKLYADGQAKIEEAKYRADAERYKAMAVIAQSGNESAQVAAVVALALGQSNGGQQTTKMQAPQANEALQWASLLVPSVTQLAGISANMRLGMAQSDNAARVAVSTNEAFVGIAGKIQAPAANVTTTTNTTTTNSSADTTTTFSGTGVLGSGSYATTANPSTTTTSNANPTTTTTTTNANPTTTTTSTVTCTGNTVTTGNNGCPLP